MVPSLIFRVLTGGVTFFMGLAGAVAQEDPPWLPQVRAATAVVIHAEGSGNAFCISESGLFLASTSLVSEAKGRTLDLVLDPGGPAERHCAAQVVRTFKEAKAVLLRAEIGRPISPLKLSLDALPVEKQPVMLFGYRRVYARSDPLVPGKLLQSVIQTVSQKSAKRENGLWISWHTDPGCHGAPVLDEQGQVIGMNIVGAQVTAIPVAALKKELSQPSVFLPKTKIPFGKRDTPVEFSIGVDWVVPPPAEPEVALEITARGAKRRVIAHKGNDGTYRATLPPLPPPPAGQPRICGVSLRAPAGTATGTAEDFPFEAGGRATTLAECSTLQRGADGGWTADGAPLKSSDVLQKIRFSAGTDGVVSVVDARTNDRIDVVPMKQELEPITWRATVRAGELKAEATGTLSFQIGVDPTGGAPLLTPREIALPGVFSDVVAAGNGTALIFQLKGAKKLAVLDVPSLKIRGFIALPEEPALVAGGALDILVGYPGQSLIQRYSLQTLEREKAIPTPPGELRRLAMGDASRRLAMLSYRGLDPAHMEHYQLLDVAEMTFLEAGNKTLGRFFSESLNLRAGGNGLAYGVRVVGSGCAISLRDQQVEVKNANARTAETFLPSPDGTLFFNDRRGVFTSDLAPVLEVENNAIYGVAYLPAYHPSYFFGVPYGEARPIDPAYASLPHPAPRLGNGDGVMIFAGRSSAPLLQLPEGFAEMNPKWLVTEKLGMTIAIEKRFHYFPQWNLFLTLPLTNDRVVARTLDLHQLLAAQGTPFLHVTSIPPAARVSQRYVYQITSDSSAGGVTYHLESGPPQMTMTPAGRVEWLAPATPGKETVIVRVRDAGGREIFHTFAVMVDAARGGGK